MYCLWRVQNEAEARAWADFPAHGEKPIGRTTFGGHTNVSLEIFERVSKMISKAEEYILALRGLISEAESLEPRLADRLKQIAKWISKFSPGEITAKRYLIVLLEELCVAAELWLLLATGTPKEQSAFLSTMETADMYWSTCLFSAWFSNKDLKASKWQRALVANEYIPTNTKLVAKIDQAIRAQGGTLVSPLIADLAMATDIIATGNRSQALCVHVTTQSGNYLLNKYADWEMALLGK